MIKELKNLKLEGLTLKEACNVIKTYIIENTCVSDDDVDSIYKLVDEIDKRN